MNEKEYWDKFQFLFNKEEYLSEKLKKISYYSAKSDLDNEISLYHLHLAQARIDFNDYITVYKLKNELIEKITNTKIENMPNETPKIFTKPFIIETIDNKTPLFGDINSVLGYSINVPKGIREEFKGIDRFPDKDKLFSILFHSIPKEDEIWYNEAKAINILMEKEKTDFSYLGSNLFRWSPYLEITNWEFSAKDYSREVLMNKDFCRNCKNKIGCKGEINIENIRKYKFCFQGLCDNIISFLTVFNYMLEAENTPIVNDNSVEIVKRTITKRKKLIVKNENWIIKYLYIDKKKIQYENNDDKQFLDKDGLVKKNVQVKGHLRNQACGVGHKEHKWIYIESFTTTKWIKEGDKKIIVNLYNDNE